MPIMAIFRPENREKLETHHGCKLNIGVHGARESRWPAAPRDAPRFPVALSTTEGVGALMKALGQRYMQHVNRTYGRCGTLWAGRFRSCLTQEESCLLACHRYIELNPMRGDSRAPCAILLVELSRQYPEG